MARARITYWGLDRALKRRNNVRIQSLDEIGPLRFDSARERYYITSEEERHYIDDQVGISVINQGISIKSYLTDFARRS